jgi:hypothetical protein
LFCSLQGKTTYPAQLPLLLEWIAQRVFGNSSPGMKRVSGATIRAYVSAIRSQHVDRNLPTDIFEQEILKRMLNGATAINPSHRNERNRRPITRQVLTLIVPPDPAPTAKSANIDAAYCLAYAGCLRIGEISYT